MKNPIIILGGMGPQASHKLHKLILDGSRSFHNGNLNEYPAILHASIQVPDFIDSSDSNHHAVSAVLEVCEMLPLKIASAIGLACNTAHLMVNELPLEGTSFVSMIEAVGDRAQNQKLKKVGLLASTQTVESRLYSDMFEKRGIQVIKPNKYQQDELSDIIHNLIAGHNPELLRERLSLIATDLVKNGADSILLGCTELPIIGLNINPMVIVLDSLQILADTMLQKHYQRIVQYEEREIQILDNHKTDNKINKQKIISEKRDKLELINNQLQLQINIGEYQFYNKPNPSIKKEQSSNFNHKQRKFTEEQTTLQQESLTLRRTDNSLNNIQKKNKTDLMILKDQQIN